MAMGHRQIITLNVGQCGIQLGSAIWEQYCAEHAIPKNGRKDKPLKINKRPMDDTSDNEEDEKDNSFNTFFRETQSGQYVPRQIMIDLEPNVIDDIKTSSYRELYDHRYLLNGKEDAANIFARGFYTVGTEIIDTFNDRIRKLVDECDICDGFLFNHAVGGGTGSGLGSLMLHRIAVDYRRKFVFGYHVYPSPTYSTCVVEPYNAVFTTHWLLDHTDTSIILDNEQLYELCQNKLDIKRPSYDNINRLCTKAVSTMTAGYRFKGELNYDWNGFMTNMGMFPRIHFMTVGMAPILCESKMDTFNVKSVNNLTELCFDASNFFIKMYDFDPEQDQYMTVALNYRGNINIIDATNATQWLKANKKCTFVEWVPTGFKIGLNQQPPVNTEYDDIAPYDKNIVMIGNNTCISRLFAERLSTKFDKMYSQRAFVHWYVGEGMEEGEFAECREDMAFLEKDYLLISSNDFDESYHSPSEASEEIDDDENV